MQRIFKPSEIQNNNFTHELKILIYEMPSYGILGRSYKLLKIVELLAHHFSL